MPEKTVEDFFDSPFDRIEHFKRLISEHRNFFDALFVFLNQPDFNSLMVSAAAEIPPPHDGEGTALCPLLTLQASLEQEPWYVAHLSRLDRQGVRMTNRATGAIIKFYMREMGHETILRSHGDSKAACHPLAGQYPWSIKSAAIYAR